MYRDFFMTKNCRRQVHDPLRQTVNCLLFIIFLYSLYEILFALYCGILISSESIGHKIFSVIGKACFYRDVAADTVLTENIIFSVNCS